MSTVVMQITARSGNNHPSTQTAYTDLSFFSIIRTSEICEYHSQACRLHSDWVKAKTLLGGQKWPFWQFWRIFLKFLRICLVLCLQNSQMQDVDICIWKRKSCKKLPPHVKSLWSLTFAFRRRRISKNSPDTPGLAPEQTHSSAITHKLSPN